MLAATPQRRPSRPSAAQPRWARGHDGAPRRRGADPVAKTSDNGAVLLVVRSRRHAGSRRSSSGRHRHDDPHGCGDAPRTGL